MKSVSRMLLCSLALCGASTATAQSVLLQTSGQQPPAPKATIVRLKVDPAAEPRPALKYALMTRLSDRKPGNAVPFYYRAILAFTEASARSTRAGGKALDMQLSDWTSTPIDKLPVAEVRKVVEHFRNVLEDVATAAGREECNWDWRVQDIEGTKGFEFLLEEIQQSRGLARLLAVKARLEIAEHRFDDAIETLRIGNELAAAVAKNPLVITGLVGVAIANLLDDQMHTLMATAGAPNLYWALTELPRPQIDLRPSIEFELSFPFRIFPWLKNPQTALHSPEQWAEIISKGMQMIFSLDRPSDRSTPYWEAQLAATGLALRGYTRAKQELIAAGYDASKIEKMPVGQVLAIHEASLCRQIPDEIRKWTLVGLSEGVQKTHAAEERLIHERYISPIVRSRETLPILSLLLPATPAAYDAMVRREVSLAADRVIEALRMQAAHDGGKLPASLAEITVVPVPNNPRTGQPFPYHADGDRATLEVRRSSYPPAALQETDYVFEISLSGRP
jgi:hypothetical protein